MRFSAKYMTALPIIIENTLTTQITFTPRHLSEVISDKQTMFLSIYIKLLNRSFHVIFLIFCITDFLYSCP